MLVEKLYHENVYSYIDVIEEYRAIFNGQRTSNQISALLTAIQFQKDLEELLLGTVLAMKELGNQYNMTFDKLLDNCGTGGDKTGSFNISTTVSFIAAAGGVRVAKHGNRSVTSKSGSADLLEKVKIPFPITEEEIESSIKKYNAVFLFAPFMHEQLAYVKDIRKELKIPTIFNIAGPLANPLPITHQLMGVYHPKYIPIVANVLKRLGRKRAIVICGDGGVDEAILSGNTAYAIIENDQVYFDYFNPLQYGFPKYSLVDIKGGTVEENEKIFYSVLKGEESAFFDTVIFNAAIAFFAAEDVSNVHEGVEKARDILTSGKALALYEAMKEGE